jgi:hypothetical protein
MANLREPAWIAGLFLLFARLISPLRESFKGNVSGAKFHLRTVKHISLLKTSVACVLFEYQKEFLKKT